MDIIVKGNFGSQLQFQSWINMPLTWMGWNLASCKLPCPCSGWNLRRSFESKSLIVALQAKFQCHGHLWKVPWTTFWQVPRSWLKISPSLWRGYLYASKAKIWSTVASADTVIAETFLHGIQSVRSLQNPGFCFRLSTNLYVSLPPYIEKVE